MDWKTYPYTQFWNETHIIEKLPLINVELSKNGKKMPQLAMLDSGASMNMMSEEQAEFFDIDKSKCKKILVQGIVGGQVECYSSQISMKVDGFDQTFEVPILFVPGLKTTMLLGQIGFFSNFKVKFDHKLGEFYLISIDEEIAHMEGFSAFHAQIQKPRK
jgi:hypothetical protein